MLIMSKMFLVISVLIFSFTNLLADTGTNTIFVKIKFHTFTASYVTNVTESNARTAFNSLNSNFQGSNIEFLWEGFESHDGTLYLTTPDASWEYMLISGGNYVNLTLLPADIDFDQSQANRVLSTSAIVGGSQEFLNSSGGISSLARINSGVVTHEIGHCLYLWHTHHGTNSLEAGTPELIDDPTTWVTGGDLVSDTRPDPGLYNRTTDQFYVNSSCYAPTRI